MSKSAFSLATVAIAACSVAVQPLKAQSDPTRPVPEWQTNAGSKMAFDVASVKRDTVPASPQTVSSTFPLGPDGLYTATGGLFRAVNIPLFVYITFAYKLSVDEQRTMLPRLPKWVAAERFDIEARSMQSSPTKDQMRLMMQALLSDRFKLVTHTETHEEPIYALVLMRPGETGPDLRPHTADEPACAGSQSASLSGQATIAGGYPLACEGIVGGLESGRLHGSARDVTMELIAGMIEGAGNLERKVTNKTGLSGTFDFVIEYAPPFEGPLPPGVQVDSSAPTFLEALKDQLGLKLQPQRGPVEFFVVDHIEEPLPN